MTATIMNNTRKEDLGILEEARDKASSQSQKNHLNAILASVYDQSKDSFLEKKRVELEDALRKGDLFAMSKIRSQIIEYTKTPTFITGMLKKVRKATSEKEAIQQVNTFTAKDRR